MVSMKWRITAEHCGGKSVGDDPADDFDVDFMAQTEREAVRLGYAELEIWFKRWNSQHDDEPQAGTDSWWNSVVVHAVPAEVEYGSESDWYEILDDCGGDLESAINAWRLRLHSNA